MTIDITILAILISLIISILAGGAWLGRMWEKIKSNRRDIDENKDDVKTYQRENADQHRVIISRLDRIINGKD